MKTQIPIYRAKKIDSDEYVEGYIVQDDEKYFIITSYDSFFEHDGHRERCGEWITDEHPTMKFFHTEYHEIDPSTLSISFPDMLDKNGVKIFASLSEDGVGGSEGIDLGGNTFITVFDDGQVEFIFNDETLGFDISSVEWAEVTGIHKGE